MVTVLPNGGEIHFKDDRNAHNADRIEILEGGLIRAIYKRQYSQEIYPPEEIKGVYTHTNALEDEEWW